MRLLFVLTLLFIFNFTKAQDKNLLKSNVKFKNYTTKDGLSQISVTSILQDDKGFMWFGTRYGLNRFDGYNFKNYNFRSNDTNSISNNWITKIFKDKKGNIWVGTKKGLNKYNPKRDNFTRTKHYSKNKLYAKRILDISIKDSTKLLVSTNSGIDFFDLEKEIFVKTDKSNFITKKLSSKNVKKVLISSRGKVFIATKNKVDVFDLFSNSYNYINYPNQEILSPNTIVTLFEDENANILMGYSKGLMIYNEKNQSFLPYLLQSKNKIAEPVRVINQDFHKNLWVGTYKGLFKIDNTKNLTKYIHSVTDDKSLTQNSIYDLFIDTSDGLWVGTWGGGISYYNEKSNNFLTYKEGFNKENLNYNVVSSFLEDDLKNLWIGTEGGGINILDTKQNSFSFLKHNPSNINSISSNNVKALLKDHKNNIWVGTHGGGLNQIIKTNKKQKIIRYNNLNDNKITTLFEDDNKNIWIGTNEGGLNFLNTKTQKSKVFKSNKFEIGNFIYHIIKQEHNHIYVASDQGLTKINIQTQESSKINYRTDNESSFGIKTVITVFKENDNNLWIGTGGDGLYNYNLQTQKSTKYGLDNGLADEFIHSIKKDNFDNLWVSTNKGLSAINLKNKKIKNYQQEDGLQSNEFNFNASIKTSEGNLAFGGIEGFTYFNPLKIKEDKFIPPITINSFQLRNESEKIFSKALKNLALKYDENDFSIDFIALEYSKPNKINYAYILEGLDKEWNYVGNKKNAVYTNLNPGDYTFKVKASNTEGDWIYKNQIAFNLKINKPIWKTYWAYSLYLIIFLSIFWIARRYELLRIKNKKDLKQERLDKAELKEINKLKLQLFTNISHDFRTPLTLIIGPLKKMINEKKGTKDIQNKLELMHRNAQTLLQLINQFLDFRKSEAGKLHIYATKNDLVSFIEDCKLSFEELASSKNIKYKLYVSEEIDDLWFDKIEMKKVILNILSNAFKFTPKDGSISIQIKYSLQDKSKVKIKIKDSGKGIPKEDVEKVFNRYFQLGQNNEQRAGSGVGLALAKDIVELHSGKISVKSKIDVGTEFTVSLFKGKKHLKKSEIIENEDFEKDLKDYDSNANVKSGWVRQERNINTVGFNPDLQTVLIVEDNNDVRAFINEIFNGLFNIVLAKNGLEGIEASKQNNIDVIVSDLMMPKMDGLEMCKNLKLDIRTSHIPIIMLTARTSSKVQKKGYETGADVYITKPFDAENLKLQVFNILKSRKLLIDKFKKDILIEPKEITVVSADEKFLKKAMSIIEENFSNPEFNVTTFTDKMFMSQSILYRKIKILTGQSISEFIRTIRLKKASQLLIKTDKPIKNIVYDIGFNDIKYFRKCFKESFKVTPSQYRKENKLS